MKYIFGTRINLVILRWHLQMGRLQTTGTLTSVTCSQCLERCQSEDRWKQVSTVTYKHCVELV